MSDQDNFRYYPALYLAAVGGNPFATYINLSEIFKGRPVEVVKDTAKIIDRQKRRVKGVKKSYEYDVLVIALGVMTNFFGIKGLDKYAYGIKTLQEAQKLRDHIHKQLIDEQQPDLNYVVIGGGPTGVELAGALPSYIHHVMKNHGLKDRKIHVDLVEAAPRLMPRMPKDYSSAVARHLRRLGVKLYLNEKVQAESADALMVSGHPIDSHTVVWTAGVTNHPFLKANGFIISPHGKAVVDNYLRAEEDIYIIGDNADTTYSGMAQTALYDAVFVTSNLKRQAAAKKPKAYRAKKPIYVTPAGPGWAAVIWGPLHTYGWLGWAIRSAADLRGYKDFEPWWLASKHWMATMESEESCAMCAFK
jgi:NADH dehydrogenase